MTAADAAFDALDRGLATSTPACGGDDRFTLDAHLFQTDEVVFLSAKYCWPCPVRALCRSYADAAKPQAGLWAGRIYGPRRDTPISDSPADDDDATGRMDATN